MVKSAYPVRDLQAMNEICMNFVVYRYLITVLSLDQGINLSTERTSLSLSGTIRQTAYLDQLIVRQMHDFTVSIENII